jgi:hypothetical protein
LSSLAFAVGIALLAFCAGIVGLKLHVWLPERHAPDRARGSESYGPETRPAREGLRRAIQLSFDKVWGGPTADLSDVSVKSVVAGSKVLDQFLLSLSPKTEAQKQGLATASAAAGQIAQTRILMMLQLAGGISWPMVAIVVGWSLLLFCGYGLVSPMNATVVTSMALGAIAVASAIFLIIELSQPYSGLFRIPPAALSETIQALGW